MSWFCCDCAVLSKQTTFVEYIIRLRGRVKPTASPAGISGACTLISGTFLVYALDARAFARLFFEHFDALPRCRGFALFIAAVRLAAGGCSPIRPGDLCGRCARRRLVRRFPRPDIGGEKVSLAA